MISWDVTPAVSPDGGGGCILYSHGCIWKWPWTKNIFPLFWHWWDIRCRCQIAYFGISQNFSEVLIKKAKINKHLYQCGNHFQIGDIRVAMISKMLILEWQCFFAILRSNDFKRLISEWQWLLTCWYQNDSCGRAGNAVKCLVGRERM